jgi:LDH2 family malate/lactate/ureidoglycolate dehydrogenase
MDNWISRFRNAKPSAGNEKVLIPGDPEREMELLRMKQGIPVVETVVNDLSLLAEKFGMVLK